MLRNGNQADFIRNRVNMPTDLSHAELVQKVSPKIKSQAFFSARVADARILEKLRSISDGYSRGDFGLADARNQLKDFLRAEGYDPHQAGLRNLASTARLNLILRQNAAMAHAAGEWARMRDPDALKVFPYVRYHARRDSKVRSSHSELDGKIFHKLDPFLKTHTPPWEFNCRCYLEEITAKEAGKEPEKIQKPTPPEQVKVESSSGFSFDPEHVFEEFDLTTVKSRASIVKQAEEAVKNQELGSVGLIVAPAENSIKPVSLPGAAQVRNGFEAMKNAARKELEDVGLDPDSLPDYKAVNEAFAKAGKQGKNIMAAVRDKFPAEPFEVTKLNSRAAESAGLPDLPVMLGAGNQHHGIEHLWRNHKELFVDPEQAIKVLRDTLGNENCRVVVSLKRVIERRESHGKTKKVPICLKRIVLHNPQKQSYCVIVYDGKQLKLVSWNNANDTYGDDEWSLK